MTTQVRIKHHSFLVILIQRDRMIPFPEEKNQSNIGEGEATPGRGEWDGGKGGMWDSDVTRWTSI